MTTNSPKRFQITECTKIAMDHQLLVLAKNALSTFKQVIEASAIVTSNKARKKIETYHQMIEKAEKDGSMLRDYGFKTLYASDYAKTRNEIIIMLADYDPIKKFPITKNTLKVTLTNINELEVAVDGYLKDSYNNVDYFKFEGKDLAISETKASMAIMFFVMDVSASMEASKRKIGIELSSMYYNHLLSQYDFVQPVFITYTTDAECVDEDEFLSDRELSGGTCASLGIELVNSITTKRFLKPCWNVHVFHISDGDTFSPAGFEKSIKDLNKLKPNNCFVYNEIQNHSHSRTDLGPVYASLKSEKISVHIAKTDSLRAVAPAFLKIVHEQSS